MSPVKLKANHHKSEVHGSTTQGEFWLRTASIYKPATVAKSAKYKNLRSEHLICSYTCVAIYVRLLVVVI